jgi:mono/diheme cytochrome c family protein
MFRFATYIVAIALLCAGCSAPHPADPVAWGQEIYARTLCGQCHGADQRGTIQGPPLENLREHWTTDELVAYLAAPMNYVDAQPRLRALADHYKMLMPAMPLTNEERRAVAAYLLQNEESTAASKTTSAPRPPSKIQLHIGGERDCVPKHLGAVRLENPGRGSITKSGLVRLWSIAALRRYPGIGRPCLYPGRGSIKPITSTSYETPPGYGSQTDVPRVAPKRRKPGLWNINPSGIERPEETPT